MVWFIPLCMLVSCLDFRDSPKEERQPNFIIVYTDDQRFDALGVNQEGPIITPNIDHLARQSLQFSNAHVAFSLCSPSRASLLTGRYGSQNGVLGLGSKLNEGEKVLPELLQDHGYVTGFSGKWHIQPSPKDIGFDFANYFFGNGTYYGRQFISGSDTLYPDQHIDDYGVDRSISFIETQARDKAPFFLFHCPQTPHMNGDLIWDAKPETKVRYPVDQMPVPENHLDGLENKPPYLRSVRNRTQAQKYGYPDSSAIQNHTRDYYAVITELDNFLGRLFDKISELDLWKHTYLIFMSDNGWMLGDHGFTSKVLPYAASTHVPLFVHGPGIAPVHNNSLVSNLDILPTVIDLAKLPSPQNLHGKSLLPIIKGNRDAIRDVFVYEGLGSYGGSGFNLSVIDDTWRYTITYEDQSLKKVIFRELYHQMIDPWEMDNVVHDPAHANLLAGLEATIREHKVKVLGYEE